MNPEILHLYAWDVAFEVPLEAIRAQISQAGDGILMPRKGTPRDPAPRRYLHLPLGEVGSGEFRAEASANLYGFGVICITLRHRAQGRTLADFVPHHAPPGVPLDALARGALDGVLSRISAHLRRPRISPENPEAWTVFRFEAAELHITDATEWMNNHRREVAGLLTGEADPGRLSDQEVDETLRQTFSYYRDDLAVIDWESALVVDPGPADDVLRVFELANLQLVEYRHYDAELDRVVSRAYEDLSQARGPRLFFGGGDRLRSLRELRLSVADVADEIENATKFLGDWHLARVYMGCATRFHLPEWKAAVEEKLKTIDELYNLAASESSNRKMLLLEAMIVVLFILDLLALFLASSK